MGQHDAEIRKAEFAALSENVRSPVVTRTLDGIVTGWNPSAVLLFGYEANEILGTNFFALIPEECWEQERQILNRLRSGERTDDFETKRIHKDGRILDIAVTFLPIRDEAGNVIRAMTLPTDIHQRRRLERAERDQLFLAAIISSADDAIVSKDLNGIVTSWNEAAQRIFGYSAEEIIGHPVAILIPPDHPDEEARILERIRRGERIEHYETQRLRKDGTIIDVSITISPIRDRIGRVIGASKIARDITERSRLERAEAAQSFLGALVQYADDAILSKDLDGIVTSWNPAAEKLYGYSASEIIGKAAAILVPQDHPDEEPQILRRIRRGDRIEHFETQRQCKDGRIIEVSQTISPILDSLDRVIGISNITRDITEHKRAERRERLALRQAQEARQQAEEANRAKDEFLATVSHELRTPLTAIMGWTRMMANAQFKPSMLQKAIETIDRNARAQAQLIEDLLDISRIVSGRMRIEFKLVDLPRVVSAAVETVQPAAEAKGIRIQSVISSGAGPVLGDADRLQQVIWNLLSNAIRYTPRNGFIQIELQRVESQVEISVSDNGGGIPPAFLPHLFERFTQADTSITRSHGGLGMGLAIVKSLVELHGGVVSAASGGEGQGATFTVKLPVSAVRPERLEPPRGEKPALSLVTEPKQLVGLKILVVDDEEDTREVVGLIFEEAGAIVETAASAEEGIQRFDTWQPDIVVSDIGMPEIDGYEFIRILRKERHSRVPAVALTAMARIDDRIKALTAGYQMHVSKPVEPAELISIVSSLVSLVNHRSEEAC